MAHVDANASFDDVQATPIEAIRREAPRRIPHLVAASLHRLNVPHLVAATED
jgi:hypothetical protein